MTKRVIIIDDEPEIVNLLKSRLERHKYEVLTASDGQDGLQKINEKIPDLIILDIIMPNMDGYSFVQELKKDDNLKSIPVIVLTAKDRMQEIFEMEGVADYFVKPFDGEEIVLKVKERLEA